MLGFSHSGFATNQPNPVIAEEVETFSKAMDDIRKYYVEPVSKKELFENAIRGMLNGLDPHCAYLDKQDFQDLNEATRGQFAGVGLEVTMKHGFIQVIAALDDSPAQKVGIQSGDYIIKLDKMSVSGLTLRSAINKMRGSTGSSIALEIIRKDSSKPLNFVLKREMIHIKSVKSELLDDNYGYIKLSQFQVSTPEEMYQAIKQLKKQTHENLQGVILDLRNDPGGLLDSAVKVANAFIDGKKDKSTVIVYTKGRSPGSKMVAFATPGDLINKAPMVVLINAGSASAAEIVAGSLKDDQRALLLGTKTFGKGSVQTVIPISNDSAIKLTTALYFTPSGISIQAKGITPDIAVKQLIWKSSQKMNSSSEDLTEANLQGHLSARKTKTAHETLTLTKNDNELMHRDYQLYQALNVLKGMALTKSLRG